MTSAILIADANGARARRVAAACAARGHSTWFARNGAEALETALADVPDVVVAAVDLALIDGVKLAEILRANPRTREARFVFLGREAGLRGGGFDASLPPSAAAEDVAARVESVLDQRARVDAVEREAAADHEVQGSLGQIPLTDLLQLFHMNRRTGTLELQGREPGGGEERGAISLRDGNVLGANAGRVQGEKALFRLLAWRDGSFAFTPRPVSAPAKILTPTRALLLEGVRQIDEWNRLRERLPAMEGQIRLQVDAEALPKGVHPLTEEVLGLLASHERVRDLVDACPWPDYQVLRTLQALAERKIIAVQRREDTGGLAVASLFTNSQVRRLRDWLQAGRPRGSRPTEAKLLVVSADTATTRDFARLLGGLPGMDLEPPFQTGGFRADDVTPLGRLAVGDGLALDLIHVPGDEAFAPLWAAAAQGALGTLLLLGGDPAEAEAQLAPVALAIRKRPRARTFHVMLLAKGQRVDVRELHERLSLLDEGSLFLLKVESERSPLDRLRTMLARVMP